MSFVLILCEVVSADTLCWGQNITTVQNRTVSGGLYTDSYHNSNGAAVNGTVNKKHNANVAYNFKPLLEMLKLFYVL